MLFPAYTLIVLSGNFANSAGTLADPTTVTLRISNSTADLLTSLEYGVDITVVRDGVGLYHYDFTPPNSGTYSFQWRGTGAVVAANEASFQVEPTSF